MKTAMTNAINEIMANPFNTESIVKSSEYSPKLLSYKLRVELHNNPEAIETAHLFEMSMHEYVSYCCSKVENIKN